MQAGIYARQSIDNAEGIDRQLDRTRALVRARGWKLVEEFTDNDTSATKERGASTGWGRMLAAVREGHLEAVVAVDLDRLLRSTRDLNTLIDLGAKVVTVDGEIDLSTADGEFRATMLAGIARFESRRRHERQVRGYQHRVLRKGEQIGGWRAFGYRDGALVRKETNAIRQAYDDVLAGISLGAIARRWNAAGLTTTHGKEWSHSSVRKVLTNPRNAGLITYRGEVVHPTDENGQPIRAAWTPIVPEERYLAVRAVLDNRARGTVKAGGRRMLSGLALCGVCGEETGATVHAGGGNKAGRGTYRCSASMGHVARLAEPVENWIGALVVERLSRPDAIDLLERREDDTAELRVEAAGLRGRLEALAVDYADGLVSREQLTAGTERLRVRLAAIEGHLADAAKVSALGPLVGAEDVAGVWERLGPERQRRVIAILFERVVILPPGRGARRFDPATVRIEWRTIASPNR